MHKHFQFPANESGHNNVQASAFYKKAGVNWYNGDHEQGGFYVAFQTGTMTKGEGYNSFEHDMFGGFKIRVAEGNRDNKKKCAKILNLITNEIAESVFNGYKQITFDRLKSLDI